jgi:hypothetical protein
MVFFLRPDPRDGYGFSRCFEWNRSSEGISFKRVWGRCGVFAPLGWVEEDAKRPQRERVLPPNVA